MRPPLEPATVAVAIMDPQPLVRRGLANVLAEAGFRPQEPDDLRAWVARHTQPAVLATVSDDAGFELLDQLRRSRDDLVLVCLVEEGVPACQRALASGAHGVVPRDAPPEEVLSVFQAALGHHTLLRADVAHRIVQEGGAAEAVPELSDEEHALLRALATGDAVAQIACAHALSTRELHRRLNRLYCRLGVANRSEALVLAGRARLV